MAGWDRPPLPARWGAGSGAAFVGRAGESAALNDAWALAQRGCRQVLFVGGEAGVGKSRFAAETVSAFHDQQAAVLLGTCMSAFGAPYQPFVEPIATLLAACESGQLVIDGSQSATDRVLSSLRVVTGTDPDRDGATADHRFARQLFEACARVVVVAARTRPLVLVLEDLHWAGDTALQLLEYLVGRTADCRLLIVATARMNAPDRSADLVSTVAQLYRQDGVRRLDLGGLSTEDIVDYLVDVARVQARTARGSAAMLRDLTGGSPFLLAEVWRELTARGGLSALGGPDLQAPESLRDTTAHRLVGLPAAHRRTVEIAAVIGEEVSVSLLATVAAGSGDPGDSVRLTFAGLEAATAVGLLEPVRGVDGVFRFPHGLARQAVLDLLTEYQRARDNAAVAVVLEQMAGAELRVQRLAHHYAAAQALGYSDKAVQYLAAAAEVAQTGLAHDEAARLYERAAALSGRPEQRDDLRLKAARGYLWSSRFGRARELNEAVAAGATGVDRLRAAIGYEAASWRSGQPGERSVELLSRALAGVQLDDHHPLNIRGVAALSRAHAFTANLPQSRLLGERAITLARETGDERLVAAALQVGLQAPTRPAQFAEKLAQATELTALTLRIDDLRHLGPAAYHRAALCYMRGDPDGLAAAHNDLARTARETGQQFWEWVQSCLTFGMQYTRADFPAALQTIADAREFGRRFEPGQETEGPSGLQTFMVRREIGGLEQVRGLISGDEDPTTRWAPGLLALYCELGLRAPARRLLDYLLDRELPRHQISATWPAVLSFLAEAAVWLEDRPAAQRLHPLAVEYAGLNLMGGEFSAPVGSADRSLGALESLLRLPGADERFAAALEMDTRMGSPLHVATTMAAQVNHLHRVGDRTPRVAELTGAAAVLCERHGLVRVRRMLGDVKPAGPDRAEQQAGLTARETEVLRLVGNGFSNRRIAERLVISENTAANHVRSILIKTGAANRTQAAMFASSHGLLEQPGPLQLPAQGERSTGHRLQ